MHVDGAFGLWAAASPALAGLVAGAGDADSWATDGHKWLNVPYDCGVVAVRDRAAHAAAMGHDRLLPRARRRRGPLELRLGPRGVAARRAGSRSTRRCGRWAATGWPSSWSAAARWRARLAAAVAAAEGVEVLNDVTLNQVLLRFGADDALTDEVIARVQADGTCWVGGTRWHGVGGDAGVGVELVDDRGRHRPHRRRDPRRYRRSASVVITAS